METDVRKPSVPLAPWDDPANSEDSSRRSDSHKAVLPESAGATLRPTSPPPPSPRLSSHQVATDAPPEQPPLEAAPQPLAPKPQPEQAPILPTTEPLQPLSGLGAEFDPATGWDLDALSDDAIALPQGPEVLPRDLASLGGLDILSDEGVEAIGPPLAFQSPLDDIPLPSPPVAAAPMLTSPRAIGRQGGDQHSWTPPGLLRPEQVDEAIESARKWLYQDRPGEAVAVLEALDPTARFHPQLARWIARAERTLIQRHCPDASFERVPVLTTDREDLVEHCNPDRWRLVNLIDGRTSVEGLRVLLPEMSAVRFYRALGKLRAIFAVRWSDEPGHRR